MSVALSVKDTDESMVPYKTIRLSKEEFSIFIFFLNKIKNEFNDFSVINGAFRTFSNDRKIIIETGFPFFKEVSFGLTEIKNKIKTLSTFRKKNIVDFTFNGSGYSIDDGTSSLYFVNPNQDFLDNKYILYEDMEKLVLKNLDPNKPILNSGINKKLVSRSKKLSHKLSQKNFQLKKIRNSSNELSMLIHDKSDDSTEASINIKIPLLLPLNESYYLKLPAFPFNFEKDHLYIKCYFNLDQTVTTIYSTKVNDLFINIYSQSELFSEDK